MTISKKVNEVIVLYYNMSMDMYFQTGIVVRRQFRPYILHHAFTNKKHMTTAVVWTHELERLTILKIVI